MNDQTCTTVPERPQCPTPAAPPSRLFIARHGLPPVIVLPTRPESDR
ncbi:hypothetical protein [Streptomyces sp. NPDC058280]